MTEVRSLDLSGCSSDSGGAFLRVSSVLGAAQPFVKPMNVQTRSLDGSPDMTKCGFTWGNIKHNVHFGLIRR